MHVHIYTDGSAKGNPGPGGFGTIWVLGEHEKELSRGYRLTTNNRMELLAVIEGLERLKRPGLTVTITSDSTYVVDAVTKGWVFNWARKKFKDKKNVDLWKRFLRIYPKHDVRFRWIKGHAGHHYNERCDQLAVQAADGHDLLIDEGYEATRRA